MPWEFVSPPHICKFLGVVYWSCLKEASRSYIVDVSFSISVDERMQIDIIRDGMEERNKIPPVGGKWLIQKVQEHLSISWVRHIREEGGKDWYIHIYICGRPPTGTTSMAWHE